MFQTRGKMKAQGQEGDLRTGGAERKPWTKGKEEAGLSR